MARRKITGTLPEEPVESAREREHVDARGASTPLAVTAAHRDEMDRLRELAERLEKEHGPVTKAEERAALDRIAAIDAWHDAARAGSDALGQGRASDHPVRVERV
ncbi:hypothetical protein AB0C52_26280 [Streptomyces sp. NPDC048717]|uniref:hypothetical protein n=1 Tax=Streptomyces sp. NPDC048717 TaxID=3154928 RepID=UPI0034283FDC